MSSSETQQQQHKEGDEGAAATPPPTTAAPTAAQAQTEREREEEEQQSQYIYHERQDSSLCGQHALNTLLQGRYFTAVDLSEIAHTLDAQERELMLAAGAETEDAIKFLAEDSGNVNAEGFFSADVLRLALERFGDLTLLNSASQEANATRKEDSDLTEEQGFIVNRAEHWFCLRRIYDRWWNLNSTLTRPEEIRPFYLSAFLAQLQADGYTVFVVRGTGLPLQGMPDEDELLSLLTQQQTHTHTHTHKHKAKPGDCTWYTVADLLQTHTHTHTSSPKAKKSKKEEEKEKRDYWTQLSGEGQTLSGGGGGSVGVCGSDTNGRAGGGGGGNTPTYTHTRAETEDEELARAIAMSLQER